MSDGAPREGRRRALHLATGSIGIAVFFLPYNVITITVLSLAGAAIVVEVARRVVPPVNAVVTRATAGMMRPTEERGLMNGTMLAIGYAISWLVFPPACAAAAIIVAAAADPAAAMVGTAVSPSRGRKTLAGSAGAFVVALLALLLVRTVWTSAAAGAFAATVAERLPTRAGLDNLVIPLVTGTVLWALT